jgi:hypothetical protein
MPGEKMMVSEKMSFDRALLSKVEGFRANDNSLNIVKNTARLHQNTEQGNRR